MKKNNSIKEIVELIKNAKNPLFICHEHPDGDTYGAAFGIRQGMDKLDSRVACVSDLEWPFTELGVKDTVSDISELDNDLYVFLDCADEYRCGSAITDSMKKGVPTINIDHHQSNTYYADYNYAIDTSSTCELVFGILMEYKDEIDKQTADYLYMGVASDTGLFVHGYTSANTHYIAARLLEFGAEFDRIAKILFRTISRGTAFLTGKLYNNLDIVDDNIAMSYITLDDLKDCNAEYKDSEGLISHLTKIDKIEISILLKQQDENTYKASLRSTKEYDVSKLAIANGGGGHKQAAGCQFTGKIDDIKKDVLEQIHELGIA